MGEAPEGKGGGGGILVLKGYVIDITHRDWQHQALNGDKLVSDVRNSSK